MTLSAELQCDLKEFITALAHLARRETMACFRQPLDIEEKTKSCFDPVTKADKAAERAIRREIERVYPDHGILGEEEGEKETASPFRWVIDPIDGTRAFINGVASWTTLIALEHEGTPALGLIDQPVTDDMWIGIHHQHTVLISKGVERPCRTRQEAGLREARISTTDPLADVYFSKTEADYFAALAARAQMARYGLDGYGYGILAMGGLDLIIETGLAHYDAAALVPVVTGAGGKICDWAGGGIDGGWALPPLKSDDDSGSDGDGSARAKGGTGGQIIACANEALRDEVLPFLASLAVGSRQPAPGPETTLKHGLPSSGSPGGGTADGSHPSARGK